MDIQLAKKYFEEGLQNFLDKNFEDAEQSFLQSLKNFPNRLSTLTNLVTTQINLNKLSEAKINIEAIFKNHPDDAKNYMNLGNLCLKEYNYILAIENYDEAIRKNEQYAEAYYNRGLAFKKIKSHDQALNSLQEAYRLNSNYDYLAGLILNAKMQVCNWEMYDTEIGRITEKIKIGKKVSTSFPALLFSDSPYLQKRISEIWVNSQYPINSCLGNLAGYEKKEKIRIGYYSSDFYNHATSFLMAGMFELHDKSKFEIIAFSFGEIIKDNMHERLLLAFDDLIDINNLNDKEAANLSRTLKIDIAVDLKGHTNNERFGIFSYRAAPIQVSFIGYPGTTGAKYIDYLIADSIVIPEQLQKFYSEKIVYMPDSYQVNDNQRRVSNTNITKDNCGLPYGHFVFCCFNNNFKITPKIFDSWARILNSVPKGILWLLEDNVTAADNLRKEALLRGIDPAKLFFAKRINLEEHLARHSVADLFLDTLPCNAHTTASDALWSGLPVITCKGESFASRVAASLLNALDLPELITSSLTEYEALAIELATDTVKLKEIKEKLIRGKLTTALFDTPRYTKHIESAFIQMYERYHNDLPQDNIYIR